mmetsp:Transcript_8696/g.15342  ORF Transcript_8696/g.15342 Transcript_8696/m.15342 type:complete len:134 (+) Transcript_8696:50-451(+)
MGHFGSTPSQTRGEAIQDSSQTTNTQTLSPLSIHTPSSVFRQVLLMPKPKPMAMNLAPVRLALGDASNCGGELVADCKQNLEPPNLITIRSCCTSQVVVVDEGATIWFVPCRQGTTFVRIILVDSIRYTRLEQ